MNKNTVSSTPQPTKDKLWANSGNKCAICKTELIIENEKNGKVGEICHIVSSSKNGPRHRKLDDYNDYSNLIILCANHHTIIDKNPKEYPEELLKKLKKEHESKIKKIFNNNYEIAQENLMNKILDNFTDLCNVRNLGYILSKACAMFNSIACEDMYNFKDFYEFYLSINFPEKYQLIKPAFDAFHKVLGDFIDTFYINATYRFETKSFVIDRYYKKEFPNPKYDYYLEKFNQWQKRLIEIAITIAGVAKWLIEDVRDHFDKSFLLEIGEIWVEVICLDEHEIEEKQMHYYKDIREEEKAKFIENYKISDLDSFR